MSRRCSHYTDVCTPFKFLVKKAKSNRSEGYKKECKKTYTKNEVNLSRERKNASMNYILWKRWMFQSANNLFNPLMTVMHLAQAMTTETQARTRIIQLNLNIV